MDISFFERLILSGYPFTRLKQQHRMRPDISRLVSRLFYQDLEDYPSVRSFRKVTGLRESVFFLRHRFEEAISRMSKSRSNEFEAHFLLLLASHLVSQGYKKEDITVLTTYVGQQILILQVRIVFAIIRGTLL